ncbi:alpha/beta fold hydrolase [Couchioplanes caeruleus]|uniref:Haloalkane dehalogenase n=2 Tax=Couchioplanes caeruleus TaxID=56438 RepID=A0A1K0GXB8_9ACTN|nr:alpha/beta hydrolase [Couchioplanes caeruleus]OJF16060.1 Haloalkane dehalogenase [Couchioplanes caeruleus subsp. caeruleus]ROP29944.1 pimeloyl-ACP methyl ester carboxylesterase [Couchioplanes caeruleus]
MAVSSLSSRLNAVSYVAPRLAGRRAFKLFIEPLRRAEIRPAQQQVMNAATVSDLDHDGVAVKTYRWGDGPRPVLLVHGFQSRAASWAGLVPALHEAGLPVLAYDAPGHGDSGGVSATIVDQAAIIARLQEKYGPFRAIVGHSFGVLCAYHAIRSGVRPERLVAISGISSFAYLADAFCTQMALRPAISRELRRRTEIYFRPQTDIWERFSPTYRPEQIAIPTMVLHDEDDKEVPVLHGRRIAEAYPASADLVLTQGLGHRRILGDPGVIETVSRFLTKTDE